VKKEILVAGFALAGCVSAHAQTSVTLYGIIDTNLEYVTHANASGGSLVQENSGGLSDSRFGIRGTEDLGGGNSAWFILEDGFDANNGSFASAGTIFNRTAAVGLSNAFGSLSAGLETTAMYDILINYDPMFFGQQNTWLPASGASDSIAFKARMDNMLKYVGKFGGVTATADYSFGGDAGSFQSSAAYDAGFDYDAGSFGVAGVFEDRNGAVNSNESWTKTRNWSVAFRQNVGSGKLLAGYEHYLYNPTESASVSSSLWFGGMRYLITPSFNLTTAAYYQSNKAAAASNAWMGVISADYILSKSTDLYATVAYAAATRDGNGAYTPVGINNDTAFGPNQTGVTLGIRHRF